LACFFESGSLWECVFWFDVLTNVENEALQTCVNIYLSFQA
jgi:hypothetical protein